MRLYSVTIYYREPAFELRLRRQGPPYRYTFDVRARDERSAVEMARRQFDEMAQISSVGWAREIVEIEVGS
jgi:1,2-phenylacetyl-CoA epoxidase PaaB subunit